MELNFCSTLIAVGFAILIFGINAPFVIRFRQEYVPWIERISGNAGWLFIAIGLYLQYNGFCG